MTDTEKNSMELSERFEAAFNRIHQRLKNTVKNNDTDAFIELLHSAARNHASIRAYLDELKQYAKLRNAIVHQKTDTHYYIAQPHEDIVEKVEQIDRMLSEPAEALSIASKPVYTVEPSTPLTKVLELINMHSYSDFPVYARGKCEGLLTAKGVLKWLAENHSEGQIDISTVKVSDILPLEMDHTLVFLKRDANIFDIEFTFEEYQEKNKKLEAVLITENGTAEELPVGIITSWDLTKNNDELIEI